MVKGCDHLLKLAIVTALTTIQAEYGATDQELADALIDVTARYQVAREQLARLQPQDGST